MDDQKRRSILSIKIALSNDGDTENLGPVLAKLREGISRKFEGYQTVFQ